MAKRDLIHVYLSITTLVPDLAREMEPRTSIPTANEMPARLTTFKLRCIIHIKMNVPIMDMGIAMATARKLLNQMVQKIKKKFLL